jgi:hypothetical protein
MEILLEKLEERIERGELMIQVKSSESDRTLKRINIAVKALIYACLTGFLVLAGAVVLVGASGAYGNWAIAAFVGASFSGISLIRALIQLSIREKIDNIAEQ